MMQAIEKTTSNESDQSSTVDGSGTVRGPPVASWEAVLRPAIAKPGMIHEAYSRFYEYSLRNQLLAICQCMDRGLTPGPIATFKQ